MSLEPIVPIDKIKQIAKDGAARGLSLDNACPYPFDTAAGRLFKEVYFFHKAALAMLATTEAQP